MTKAATKNWVTVVFIENVPPENESIPLEIIFGTRRLTALLSNENKISIATIPR
jgi:hypothetical protein